MNASSKRTPKTVSSLKNPAVLYAKSLQSAKGRQEQGAFLLDGEHMVGEALRECPQRVSMLFLEEGREGAYEALLPLLPADAECFLVPARVMETLSQVKCSQGIAAVCRLPENTAADRLGSKLVLLENVQDPGNVGTVLRTLDAAGFEGCILTPGCADPYGGKTLRASMGSVFRVPVHFTEDGPAFARVLAGKGYEIIGAELHGDDFYRRKPLGEKLCILIGNEGAGLTEAALESCTRRYKLPMRGRAESLNAAVAAAIFMYDIINR